MKKNASATLSKFWLFILVSALAPLTGFGPGESLGCGGTEYVSASQECSGAEFHMTPQVGDWDPITRTMCFQSLKSEGGCTVYKYRMARSAITSEAPEMGSEMSAQYVNINHGSGCAENRLNGSLVEIIDHQRVEMTLSGTPTRAPIPVPNTKSPEPLATGTCTYSDGREAKFELFVLTQAE